MNPYSRQSLDYLKYVAHKFRQFKLTLLIWEKGPVEGQLEK